MSPRNLAAYEASQVFLNHPYDREYAPLGEAISFAVVAGGLLPVTARDLSAPDKPRLYALVEAIRACRYSVHDLSRCTGEGPANFARMNMPLEMGMGMYHALSTQLFEHRCSFLVATPYDHQRFASDLAGLDPLCHEGDAKQALAAVYDWLRGIVPPARFSAQSTAEVAERHERFLSQRAKLVGGGPNGDPTHEEIREVMYEVCGECGWWDWRNSRNGLAEFPRTPLSWQ